MKPISPFAKPPSQRQLRVGEEIRHALADIFMRGDANDPDITGAITVSEVRISPDLKNATAYFMPLGGLRKQEVLEALERSAPHLRHLVGLRMKLRYTPRISFRLDNSYDEAHRIEELLNKPEVARDLDK
jgi:ribosome-binding factor A